MRLRGGLRVAHEPDSSKGLSRVVFQGVFDLLFQNVGSLDLIMPPSLFPPEPFVDDLVAVYNGQNVYFVGLA